MKVNVLTPENFTEDIGNQLLDLLQIQEKGGLTTGMDENGHVLYENCTNCQFEESCQEDDDLTCHQAFATCPKCGCVFNKNQKG